MLEENKSWRSGKSRKRETADLQKHPNGDSCTEQGLRGGEAAWSLTLRLDLKGLVSIVHWLPDLALQREKEQLSEILPAEGGQWM